ncbi:MAG: putative stress-responsive transcriptional regulator [Bacteroidetes bacterium]|nr:MAG: putative stress-responsive transcriptional regulator [Bacteroidota bacterium]
MNKTVTINISGIIFHIEEDAYDKLGKYLLTIRGYFKNSEGCDEIMADIEARIAEMLQERVSQSKQVVLMADVDHVIAVMGEPEEFAGDNAQTETKTEDPKQETSFGPGRRRLFRDPDEGVIGGVCTGLGYYFGIDPVWIRAAFAIAFFIFGTGLLFYILLLIIIPKAQTTAEKLEMRGENINVNNIRRTVEEEFENLKRKMSGSGERWRNESRFGDAIGDFFRGVFRVFGKLFAGIMVVVGIAFLIGLFTSMFSISNVSSEAFDYVVRSIFPDYMFGWAIAAAALFFGIPCVMMIYKGMQILLKLKYRNNIINFSALGLWLAGLVLSIWVITSAVSEFAEGGEVSNTIPLTGAKQDTMIVKVNIDPEMLVHDAGRYGNSRWQYNERGWHLWKVGEDSIKLGYPGLHIEEAEGDSFELLVVKSSEGPDRKTAFENARRIHYKVVQKDSLIVLNSCFELAKGDKYRGQQVDIYLRVPKNKVIFLHKSTRDILDGVPNVSNTWDGYMADRRWIMTARGLACVDCSGLDLSDVPEDDDYHHDLPKELAEPEKSGKKDSAKK